MMRSQKTTSKSLRSMASNASRAVVAAITSCSGASSSRSVFAMGGSSSTTSTRALFVVRDDGASLPVLGSSSITTSVVGSTTRKVVPSPGSL